MANTMRPMGGARFAASAEMTPEQHAQGRAQWLAGGGQDSPQGQNRTPAQMAQMRAGIGAPPAGMPPAPGMQAFGATNNLIGQQINPTNSAQTNAAQGRTETAAGQYANQAFTPFSMASQRSGLAGANTQMQGLGLDFGAANTQYGNAMTAQQGARQQSGQMLQGLAGLSNFGGGTASANTGRFNQELDGALAGLQGPDRAKLAADAMALMEERSRGEFDRSLREVNSKAAAMGRRGAGMTTNDLGDVTTQREKLLDRSRRDLALDAAQRTLDDRMAISNQQRGIAGDRFQGETFNAQLADRGLDRSAQAAQFGANFQRGIAGDIYGMGRDTADLSMQMGDRFGTQARDRTALGERQAAFGRDTALNDADLAGVERRDEFSRADFGRQRFNDFAGFQRDREGQDRSNRNELRDERGYQYGLSRDAVDDEFRRIDTEERIRNNRFGRAMDTTNFGFGAASPGGAYANAGAIAGQQSADGYGAMGQLLGTMAMQRGRRGGAGTGTGG